MSDELNRQELLSALTTEHFTLQGARVADGQRESGGRRST